MDEGIGFENRNPLFRLRDHAVGHYGVGLLRDDRLEVVDLREPQRRLGLVRVQLEANSLQGLSYDVLDLLVGCLST